MTPVLIVLVVLLMAGLGASIWMTGMYRSMWLEEAEKRRAAR